MQIKQARFVSATLLAGAAVFAQQVKAQEADTSPPAQTRAEASRSLDAGNLAEVVVSARRRDERLQDVPISVTALGAAQLESRGVQDIQEIGRFVPNVTLADTGRTNNTNIFIRGVGGGNANASSVQSGVGIYIDGVYMPRNVGGYMSTLDVERIEVLRGPQGTLFGKNTTGGAINVISKKPGPNLETDVTLRVGNYGQFDVRASLNVPLIPDKLFTRVSTAYETREGFYTERTTGDTYDDNQVQAMRAALRWLPTSSLTLDLVADFINEPEKSKGGTCVWDFRSNWQNILQTSDGIDFQDICTGDPSRREFSSDLVGYSDTKLRGVNFTGSWNAGHPFLFLDDPQIKLITAWRAQSQAFLQDSDFTSARVEARGRTAVEQKQRTVELQLNGSAINDRLRLVSGLYWADDIAEEGGNDCRDELESIDISAGEQTICRQPNGFLFITLPGAATPGNSFGTTISQIYSKIETEAVYANLSFDATSWLNLTAGARHSWETREFSRLDLLRTDAGVIRAATLNEANIAIDQGDEEEWTAWTPMASVRATLPSVRWVDDANVYFTYARGFLSGGFNTEFPREFLGDKFTFDPETVNSYEVGIKSVLFGGRAVFNFSAFQSRYQDRQETINLENLGQFPSLDPTLSLIDNAATADIDGYELELMARPLDAMRVNLAAGYIHARYGSFQTFDPNVGATIDVSDRRIYNLTPEWQATGSVDYRFDLPGGTSLTPMLTAYFRSGYEFKTNTRLSDPPSAIYQDAFTKLDARLTWLNLDERIRVALWGKNVFDKDTIAPGSIINAGQRGWTVIQLEAPRTYGVEAQFRF